MTEITRRKPAEVREAVKNKSALLVSTYEDKQMFLDTQLEGAISVDDLLAHLPTLGPEVELVFY